MTSFTDHDNNELLSCAKFLANRGALTVEPLSPLIEQAPAARESYPMETTAEAILLYDMFASFLRTEEGRILAVAGGFGLDGKYHVVGAGNVKRNGVSRTEDELCTVLAQACTEFISGTNEPPNPDDMSRVLIAALNICHSEVARRLNKERNSTRPPKFKPSTLDERESYLHDKFRPVIAALKRCLNMWKDLESRHKTKVAILYGQILEAAPGLWAITKDFRSAHFGRDVKLIGELNDIATGLCLLRKFPSGTIIVFDWPQGPMSDDRFRCHWQPTKALWRVVVGGLINELAPNNHELQKAVEMKWKKVVGADWTKPILHTNCKLHCEIYLALYILFSNSDVRFDSFLVAEEGKQVFAIGCSMASCIACWHTLLGLSRQDSHNVLSICRTRSSHGRSYDKWGPPRADTLPPSLQAATILQRTQMLSSLDSALKYNLRNFKQRVETFILAGHTNQGHSAQQR